MFEAIWNRARNAALGMAMRFHVAAANRWRDAFNPLRGLTIARVVRLLEDGERGAYAEAQWTYRFIEMQDPTLGALVERRTSALQEMDWDIGVNEGLEGAEAALAERQQAALRELYEGIGNLKAAIEFLALGTFRGFSHLEKVWQDGRLVELAPVDQWHWVRDGLNGEWRYNKDSVFGTIKGEEVPDFAERFVVREVCRPVNRVALVAVVRKGLSQKDWDGYLETFGIDSIFAILPPNVPPDKEDEYQALAEAVVSGARGSLPHGSDIKTVAPGNKGGAPFKEHLDYQDQQVVLRGTGGKLTMLTESGSGTLAGGAHSDTFDQIARAEAAEISELLHDQIDQPFLEKLFPGQKVLAKFEIAANEETDTGKVVEDVSALSAAGYQVSAAQIRDKTGYEVMLVARTPEETPDPEEEEPEETAPVVPAEELEPSPPVDPDAPVRNRDTGELEQLRLLVDERQRADYLAAADADIEAARQADLAEIAQTLADALQVEDAAERDVLLALLLAALPNHLTTPHQDEAWTAALVGEWLNGWAEPGPMLSDAPEPEPLTTT